MDTKEMAPYERWIAIAAIGVALAGFIYGCLQPTPPTKDESAAPTQADFDVYLADTRPAAEVEGTAITEGEVTATVMRRRVLTGLSDDEAWEKWLASQMHTPETYRLQTIDELVRDEVLRQAAAQEDVTVDDTEVTAELDTVRQNYLEDSGYTNLSEEEQQEKWLAALAANGHTETSRNESMRMALLEAHLIDKLTAQQTEYAAWFDQFRAGKNVSITEEMPDDLPYILPNEE